MDTKGPVISVVIPCRNEEAYIASCLDSLIGGDFRAEDLEIVVVDGMSDDRTPEMLYEYSRGHPFIRVFENPKKITSAGLNLGIRKSRGKYVVILGAHSIVERNFLRLNMEGLDRYDADCVGGQIVTIPAGRGVMAGSICLVLSSPFGVGDASFRTHPSRMRHVDTVPFGCYRREVFKGEGDFFDEELIRNQDDEFNLRLRKNGGRILLIPEIRSYYYPRGTLLKLWRMYYQYGYFKPLVAKKVGGVLTWRQAVPPAYICTLAIAGALSLIEKDPAFIGLAAASYLIAVLLFSIGISIKEGARYLFTLPLNFATLHFSYGLGYLKGMLDFFLLKKDKRNRIREPGLTR
ncbi:MAG: glycosyltransferase family 2 protein [Nitrospiraceae bacterium]|nr:glycosyltransferase family 2 protein [Nitrospiraceae bacterium]